MHNHNFKKYNRGFTLMEVLVSLVVISIGLFGIAGMQLQSLKTSHDSYLRTQAAFLAYDMIDKMRGNRTAAIAGAYNTAIDAAPPNSLTNDCYSASAGFGCDENELAQFERALWKCELGFYSSNVCTAQNIAPSLSNGRGSVSIAGNQVTVTVDWEDSVARTGNNATPKPSVTIVAML